MFLTSDVFFLRQLSKYLVSIRRPLGGPNNYKVSARFWKTRGQTLCVTLLAHYVLKGLRVSNLRILF